MEAKNISLTTEALAAIESLQNENGTYRFYADTLSRLFNFVLNQSDEIGMSDTEAISTLRALRYMREDFARIANKQRRDSGRSFLDIKETADRVETTFAEVSLQSETTPGDQLDEPREMLSDVTRAWHRVNELQTIISEAITHAQNAGKKYDSVISDLADVNSDLETAAAALDAVMAIDPDNYEPKELTETEKVALFVQRSLATITYGKELLDDALDHAVRGDNQAMTRRISETRELAITAAKATAELTVKVQNLLNT